MLTTKSVATSEEKGDRHAKKKKPRIARIDQVRISRDGVRAAQVVLPCLTV